MDEDEVDKEIKDADWMGREENRADGVEEAVNKEEDQLEEEGHENYTQGDIVYGDGDTVDQTGTVRRAFVDVVPTHITQE